MLDLLLKKLEERGTYSLASLAHELDVSPAQVEQMIGHLASMGYLKMVTGCDQGQCPGCSSVSSCHTHPMARLWKLEGNTTNLNPQKIFKSVANLDSSTENS